MKHSWGIGRGLAFGAVLVVVGLLLQLVVGEVHWQALAFPVNLYVLGLLLTLVGILHLLRSDYYPLRWLSSGQCAVSSIAWALLLTLMMGLIRQSPSQEEARQGLTLLGMNRMVTFWPFVLVYSWLTLSLALVVVRRMARFKASDVSFMLSHAGLLVLLVCGALGSADMQRCRMMTGIGMTQHQAADAQGRLHALDLGIELQDFTIEEYPPMLVLTGGAGKPATVTLDGKTPCTDMAGWRVNVKELLLDAGMPQGEGAGYEEWHHRGATTAARVEATRGNERREGWVSCGNYLFPALDLPLDDGQVLIMPQRSPLRYVSTIRATDGQGRAVTGTVAVNKPLALGGWMIYQSDYNHELGRWSDVSILELVRDPWLPAVYAGIGMLLLGALGMLLLPRTKRKEGGA